MESYTNFEIVIHTPKAFPLRWKLEASTLIGIRHSRNIRFDRHANVYIFYFVAFKVDSIRMYWVLIDIYHTAFYSYRYTTGKHRD